MRKSKSHRLQAYRKRSYSNKGRNGKIYALIAVLAVSFLSLVLILSFWRVPKFYFFQKVEGQAGQIVLIDPANEKTMHIVIPQGLEVEVSRNLGTYKLENVWSLGQKEGYGNSLVVDTVKKNLSIPIHFWKNGAATNLKLIERYKLILLNLGISRYTDTTIYLNDTSYITPKKLKDGTMGYVIKSAPESILVSFSDDEMVSLIPKVKIEDLSGDYMISEYVSSLIETMGGKVVSYTKGFDKDLDCVVSSKKKSLAVKISRIFDCGVVEDAGGLSDITIRIGALFADRF